MMAALADTGWREGAVVSVVMSEGVGSRAFIFFGGVKALFFLRWCTICALKQSACFHFSSLLNIPIRVESACGETPNAQTVIPTRKDSPNHRLVLQSIGVQPSHGALYEFLEHKFTKFRQRQISYWLSPCVAAAYLSRSISISISTDTEIYCLRILERLPLRDMRLHEPPGGSEPVSMVPALGMRRSRRGEKFAIGTSSSKFDDER